MLVSEQGILKHTVPTVAIDPTTGVLSFDLPFHLVQNDKTLDVQWSFDYVESDSTYSYSNNFPVRVVTPILPLDAIARILDVQESDESVAEIEKVVRKIIQAHTGQSFGKFVGTKSITGSGEPHLRLPARLLRLRKVNNSANLLPNLVVRGDGWYIQNLNWGIPPLKADFHGLHYLSNGVIEAPIGIKRYSWAENVEYVIDGDWGWDAVPGAVQEAARILINDYSCADSAYRDRYIQSVSAVDWRMEFNSGAYSETGNVKADQLLNNYVLKRGWIVV